MERKLIVIFCKDRHGNPLTVIDFPLGVGTELNPTQLRSLANQLREIAKEAEQVEASRRKFEYTF